MAGRQRRRPRAAPDDAQTVAERYEAFGRLRHRHARLGRLVRRREADAEDLVGQSRGKLAPAVARDQVGYSDAWSRWSESYDDVASAADSLLRSRAHSVLDLCMMFSALEWALLSDGVIVDSGAERQVRRFGRGLRRLAAGL